MTTGSYPCGTSDIITGTYNICLRVYTEVNGEPDYSSFIEYDIGTTTGGVTISQNNTYEDIRNIQSSVVLATYKTEVSWKVKTRMRSLALDKLQFIYPTELTNKISESLCFFEIESGCNYLRVVGLTICGPGPGCAIRIFHFPNVVIAPDSIEYTINKENVTEVDVDFNILGGIDEVIGCVVDNVGVALDDPQLGIGIFQGLDFQIQLESINCVEDDVVIGQ